MNLFPTPQEMKAELDEIIIGQHVGKRVLTQSLYRHFMGNAERTRLNLERNPFGKPCALVVGPTGVGKSACVRALARFLGVKLLSVDSKTLVEPGYSGPATCTDSVADLVRLCDNDVEEAQRKGLLHFDEICKVARKDVARDVSGEGVQQGLLMLADGTPTILRNKGTAATIDMSWVGLTFSGAFSQITDPRVRTTLALGFRSDARTTKGAGTEFTITPDTLIAAGMIPELVGRFTDIAVLDRLQVPELITILSGAKGNALQDKQTFFALHGIELVFQHSALEAAAEIAYEKNTGARALKSVVESAVAKLEWELPQLARQGATAVIFDRGAVLGEHRPKVTERKSQGAEVKAVTELRRSVAASLASGRGSSGTAPVGTAVAKRTEPHNTPVPSQRFRDDRDLFRGG